MVHRIKHSPHPIGCGEWKSICSRAVKTQLFKACIEHILLYGAQTWTLTKTPSMRIDGCYTRLLHKSLGWTYKDRKTLEEIYGELQEPSEILWNRRLEFVGHCLRSENQPVGKMALWQSSNTLKKGQGRRLTHIKQIAADLPQLDMDEIVNLAQNRDA